jgi:AraC-like DNA-binding protein
MDTHRSDVNSFLGKTEFLFTDDRGVSAQITLQERLLQDAHVFLATSRQEKDLRIREVQDVPMLNIYFSLEGNSAAYTEKRQEFSLKDSQHMLSYTPYFDGYYEVNSTRLKNFGVMLYEPFFQRLLADELDCLKRFWEKVQKREAADIFPHGMPITGEQQRVIHEIANCSYTGHMQEMYLESKIIELYLLQAEQANQLIGQRPVAIRQPDIEKLHAARQFVKDQMFTPMSLEQVARYSGLNDFKLKNGFKQLFGTSVFGYLNELKMNYALQMLRDTGCTVAEVAHMVGYGEPHNFSKAFKKYFGYLPGQAKRR